jgi:tRNA pseudouridine38-40 synthase
VRLRIDLAYDGSGFHGWAVQPGLRTVQGELEAALAQVLRTEVALTVAGRTDTGVHARGQVAHLDVDETVLVAAAGRSTLPPGDALLRRLNGVLSPDLRVRAVLTAPPGFDARFSAVWRRYAYRIADTEGTADPLTRGFVVAWPRALDTDAMNAASAGLCGLHDFAAFCKRREGATTIRSLEELRWARSPDGTVEATVRADAFCHHMVRSLVGALVAVGEGRRPAAWPAQVLATARRDPAVRVMEPHGLTLEEVGYPPDAELGRRADEARATRGEPHA